MAEWTDAQKEAIYAPFGEGNILVSAAAGSGKTAVLVERIVNMIMNGISIDELLVVTFTEAASAEMKERIMNGINAAGRDAAQRGDNDTAKYLREQAYLTAGADINTIDAFCLNVVKNNFHILGIDPDFAIMDQSEEEMLIDDTLSELFLSLYASQNKEKHDAFIRLVNTYASNRDDDGLKKIVKSIYKFTSSFSEPLKWLREKADMYSDDMTESIWANEIFIKRHTSYIAAKHEKFWDNLREEMIEAVKEPNNENYNENEIFDAAGKYWGRIWENVCCCRDAVKMIGTVNSWDEMHGIYKKYFEKKSFLGCAINKIPAKKLASDDEWQYYYEKYNDMRDDLRMEFLKLPPQSKDDFNDYVHAPELKQTADDIAELLTDFSKCYEEKKNKRNEKSFSDIEHLAYKLFSGNENIRSEYIEKYKEILIDEYQDTNGLQDAIFTLISDKNRNMFTVGDLKQSIYRFRGGDPTIFKEKRRRYTNGDGGKCIILSQNFRSRKEVIKGINSVFDMVMSDEVGDVVYDEKEALAREESRECYKDGANIACTANREIGYNPELHRIAVIKNNPDNEDDMSEECAECAYIADMIRNMIDVGYKIYEKNGEYRNIEYRDIVILMRGVKRGGAVMRDMLESRAVPAFVQREEYFERREIKLMLSLISVINNHLQDIPLLAVMRSPIGGFSETELARIRISKRKGLIYYAVRDYRASADADESEKRLEKKCRAFISDLNRWREYVKMKPMAALIWTLYEETGFYDFMGALEGGEESQANLKLLYERAKKYEASGFKGIFNFIRYIERMEQRNDDISGASLINENHNVVRIMTIHKSKGLEFPVVFLARTGKKISNKKSNKNDGKIPLHKDLGFGLDYYNYEEKYHKPLKFSDFVNDVNKRENLSEEMRLMYVAMTRAKEKLIVTSVKAYKDEEAYNEEIQKKEFPAPAKANTYYDWIASAARKEGSTWKCVDVPISSLKYESNKESTEEVREPENPEDIRIKIGEILDFGYKYPMSGAIPAKTSVTAIKEMEDVMHTHENDPVYMTQRPKFLREKKSGAQIGTAHHQVMAYINISEFSKLNPKEYEPFVRDETRRIAEEGMIEKDIASDDNIMEKICKNISGFFKSSLGKRLFEAKRIYRECAFEIEISACEYDSSLGAEYDNEKIIVQGITDLYFEDADGNIILVDYKTDSCTTRNEQETVAEKYRKQIELYASAMEKILKKSVKDKYLYLFSSQSVVRFCKDSIEIEE